MNNAAGFVVLLGVVILAIVLGGAVLFGNIAESNHAGANYEAARGNAEATIIRAHGQAALDRAEARSMSFQTQVNSLLVLMYGSLPFGVLLIVGLLGLAVVGLAVVVALRPRPQPSIEQRIVYLLPPANQYPALPPAYDDPYSSIPQQQQPQRIIRR